MPERAAAVAAIKQITAILNINMPWNHLLIDVPSPLSRGGHGSRASPAITSLTERTFLDKERALPDRKPHGRRRAPHATQDLGLSDDPNVVVPTLGVGAPSRRTATNRVDDFGRLLGDMVDPIDGRAAIAPHAQSPSAAEVVLRDARRVRLIQIDPPEVFFGVECYGRAPSATTKQLLPSATDG